MERGKKSGVRFTVLCIKEQLVKMSCATSIGPHAFMTMYLLFVTGCITQKVYFDCGAKVDVVDVQGLILSPGFPYNYSSGIHCVWQFFVPVDYQLILEMFDFDVFESHGTSLSDSEEERTEEGVKTLGPRRLAADGDVDDDNEEDASLAKILIGRGEQVASKGTQSSYGDEVQGVVLQGELMKSKDDQGSESAKRPRSKGQTDIRATPPPPRLWQPVAQPPGGEAPESTVSLSSPSSSPLSPPLGGQHSNKSTDPGGAPLATTVSLLPPADTPTPSLETPQSVLDACPHDVLYISDLITFSSRFCGSNRPPSSQLVFGSSQEMVEVIMELITTTHWGRGFALLFHYHNLTELGGDRRAYNHASGRIDTLLAAVSAAIFFVMILASIFCVIFRPKLCQKRANSCVSSNSEATEGMEHTATEVSELRVVTANEGEREASGEQVTKGPSPGRCRTHPVSTGGEASRDQELELSPGGLMELDLGADEVFIMCSDLSNSGLPRSPRTRERHGHYSDTGPGPLSDWPLPDTTATSSQGTMTARPEGGAGCARPRPRAWSVRTFQDYLPPLPQLHKKWCSWNSTSPFTKLVDTTPPSLGADGPGDNSGRKVFSEAHLSNKPDAAVAGSASYPLTQTGQRQRRLNSTSNLRRSLFTGACFGLLSGTDDPARALPGGAAAAAQSAGPAAATAATSTSSPSGQKPHDGGAQGGKWRDPAAAAAAAAAEENDHVSVPVFAISEEEDREPLVPAEHLAQTSFSSDSLSPTTSALNGLAGGSYRQERRPPPLC